LLQGLPSRITTRATFRAASETIAERRVSWPGLVPLEVKDRVPNISFKSFGAFTAGAAALAALVGDTGPSAPENWVGDFGKGNDHVMVTLHAMSADAMTTYSEMLEALFAQGNAFTEIWRTDGMALMDMVDGKCVPTFRVHFDYTDGISMTTIRGGPERYPADHQQPCEPWLFVLQDQVENYFVPEPRELGLNDSFAVFKMIEMDVVGFRKLPAVTEGNHRSGICSPRKYADAGETVSLLCCRPTPTVRRAVLPLTK